MSLREAGSFNQKRIPSQPQSPPRESHDSTTSPCRVQVWMARGRYCVPREVPCEAVPGNCLIARQAKKSNCLRARLSREVSHSIPPHPPDPISPVPSLTPFLTPCVLRWDCGNGGLRYLMCFLNLKGFSGNYASTLTTRPHQYADGVGAGAVRAFRMRGQLSYATTPTYYFAAGCGSKQKH